MKTDDLKRAILLMVRNTELYGYDINRRLAQQDMSSNISRLYGVLNEMQKERLLKERWERSKQGPRKKMYSITDKGKEALNEILLDAISIVHRFYGDYLRSLLPKVNVHGEFLNIMIHGQQDGECLAYISNNFSDTEQIIVRILHQKNPDGKLYLIKPSTLDFSVEMENVSVMDGTNYDFPIKDDFFDRIITVGVPSQESLDESVKEWRRVINEEGRLVIVTPSILVQDRDEPIDIGDFVEMYEHQVVEGGSHVEPGLLFASLKSHFNSVVVREVTHLTFITANG